MNPGNPKPKFNFHLRNILCVLFLVAVLSFISSEGSAQSAKDTGRIVIGAGAGQTVQFAATEVQRYLKRITGTELPIETVAEREPSRPYIAIVDRPSAETFRAASMEKIPWQDLGKEGFCILTGENRILIATGEAPRSALYGVYGFLEHYFGCRWIMPDRQDEVVPSARPEQLTALYAQEDRWTRVPAFGYRDMMFFPSQGRHFVFPDSYTRLPETIDLLPKVGLNTLFFNFQDPQSALWEKTRRLFPELKKRGLQIAVGDHCYDYFLDPKKYAADNPDWWSNVEKPQAGVRGNQFCSSNPDAVAEFVRNVSSYIRENPEIDVFSPWPIDLAKWCECDKCRPIPLADRYLELSNRLFEALHQIKPDLIFFHFAYGTHLDPPEQARPVRGMDILFCAWGRDYRVPYSSPKTKEEFHTALARWLQVADETGASLAKHTKTTRLRGMGYHLHYTPTMAEDFRFVRDSGVDGLELVIEETGWWVKAFNFYVATKLAWEPDQDPEKIYADMLSAYFGPAADAVRQYITHTEAAFPDYIYWIPKNRNLFQNVVSPNRPDAQDLEAYNARALSELDAAAKCVEAGQAKAAEAGEQYVKRVEKLARSLMFVRQERDLVQHTIEADKLCQRAAQATDMETKQALLNKAKDEIDNAQAILDQRIAEQQKDLHDGTCWSGPTDAWGADDQAIRREDIPPDRAGMASSIEDNVRRALRQWREKIEKAMQSTDLPLQKEKG